MAVCNIFNDLTKLTGEFLTFSQYAEDLTQWNTQSIYHRVIPSKFIALEIPSNVNLNNSLPKLLQDKFENGCAVWRNSNDYNPNYSKSLFWNSLFELGILLKDEQKLQNVKYVGDINLQSYNEHDGMGYSEIYCHIPNDAYEYQYSYIYNNGDSKSIEKPKGSIIEGYTEEELGEYGTLWNDCKYTVNDEYYFSWEDKELQSIKIDSDSFDINSIIVLYDVYNGEDKIYENIPLGIYFTGLFKDGEIQNKITKYVHNEDIYNSGTSYGLRICSRFIMSPLTDNYIVKEVTIEDNNYAELTKLLSEIAISQSKMDEIINKSYDTSQNYKDLLSIFKNNRTNVPYIKVINGENYWFVNGRMVSSSQSNGCGCESYDNDELDNLMGIDQVFMVNAYIEGDNNIFNILDQKAIKLTLRWESLYQNKEVLADKVIVNGKPIIGSNSIEVVVDGSTSFKIESYYKDMTASTTVNIEFVYPSYFGLIDEEMCNDVSTENHEFTPSEEDIKKLNVNLYNTRQQEHTITTTETQHVCLAYPYNYGELNTITDESGYVYYINQSGSSMDIVNDFYKSVVNLNGIEYYVYTDKVPVHVINQVLKFK